MPMSRRYCDERISEKRSYLRFLNWLCDNNIDRHIPSYNLTFCRPTFNNLSEQVCVWLVVEGWIAAQQNVRNNSHWPHINGFPVRLLSEHLRSWAVSILEIMVTNRSQVRYEKSKSINWIPILNNCSSVILSVKVAFIRRTLQDTKQKQSPMLV